jgi:uncharacterized protein
MGKIFLLILLLIIALSFVVFLGDLLMKKEIIDIKTVSFGNSRFEVKVAYTPEDRARGLMFREQLPRDKGMLFIFDKPGVYRFWMKNTLISLDIIWLNENKEIVFIEHNVLPCKKDYCPNYGSEKESKYVLEINGGLAEDLGLKIGDIAIFK